MEKLEITHEGTKKVKASKIQMLTQDYELFRMKPTKSSSEIFGRFTNIITSLKLLGKSYKNAELVKKVLSCLLESWDLKKTTIKEAHDLGKLSIDELLVFIQTHELTLFKREKEKESLNNNNKNLAFKAKQSEDVLDDLENYIAILVRKFGVACTSDRFRNNDYFKRRKEIDEEVCDECKKPGHFRSNGPKLKKKFDKNDRKK